MEKHKTELAFDKLTKYLLAFLTTFNGWRPSDVQNATIANYESLEIDANNLAVFKVSAAKNGVRVPILVPDFSRVALSSLLKLRKTIGVKGDLLLGKRDGTPCNTNDLIAKLKEPINSKQPEDFSANGMRHYWATITQNIKIKKQMPKVLGHTLSTPCRYLPSRQ